MLRIILNAMEAKSGTKALNKLERTRFLKRQGVYTRQGGQRRVWLDVDC